MALRIPHADRAIRWLNEAKASHVANNRSHGKLPPYRLTSKKRNVRLRKIECRYPIPSFGEPKRVVAGATGKIRDITNRPVCVLAETGLNEVSLGFAVHLEGDVVIVGCVVEACSHPLRSQSALHGRFKSSTEGQLLDAPSPVWVRAQR